MEKKSDDTIFYGNLDGKNIQGYKYSVYEKNGICATITGNSGGGHMPYILIEGKENERDLERYSRLRK